MLEGKTALITGSTAGIGLAVAWALAERGVNIVLNGSGEPEDITRLRIDLSCRHGVHVLHIDADVSRPAEIESMMKGALGEFGCIDIVVNNAGMQELAAVDEMPPDTWDAIVAANLGAAFHTTRLALLAMKRRRFGRIVNMTSVLGLTASPFRSAYVAAHCGIVGLTKSVALEVAEAGITVNAVCVGSVATPLAPQALPATVDQVAAFTAFLCSNDAASITGALLSVTGGWPEH
jgi:3-hydroxybutyrate dehydrogenase